MGYLNHAHEVLVNEVQQDRLQQKVINNVMKRIGLKLHYQLKSLLIFNLQYLHLLLE